MILNKFFKKIIFFSTVTFLGYAAGKIPSKKVVFNLTFKTQIIDSIMKVYGPNIGILSCIRCDCFREQYELNYLKKHETPKGYSLFADSSCVNLSFPFNNLPDSLANKISDDLYNLTFFKMEKDKISYRVIDVDESKKIQKIANIFFKIKKE